MEASRCKYILMKLPEGVRKSLLKASPKPPKQPPRSFLKASQQASQQDFCTLCYFDRTSEAKNYAIMLFDQILCHYVVRSNVREKKERKREKKERKKKEKREKKERKRKKKYNIN